MIQGRQGPLSGILRLRGPELSVSPPLRSGETLSVRVVGPAGGGRWTVVVRGRTITVSSSVPLSPGSVVSARVGREGSLILLRLTSAPSASVPGPSAGGAGAQAAARALLAAGLGVTAGRLDELRSLSGGSGAPRDRRLRLAAEILRKLPDLDAADTASLTKLLGSGDATEERGGRERRRRRPPAHAALTAESVRASLWHGSPADEGAMDPSLERTTNLARLFNHVGSGGAAWVVLPCRFSSGAVEIDGSLRVLYDTTSRSVRAAVLGAGAEGGPLWWFRLTPGPSGMECRLWCDGEPERRLCAAELATLRGQLGNMGVRVADTVEDGARFDGFEPMGSSEPRTVDLLG